jgi:hypothetical protein
VAAKKKAAAKGKAAPSRPLDPVLCESAYQLRVKAQTERHGGTQLELRVKALETLVTALIDAR